MKRGIPFAMLGLTLAGVASANVFTGNPPSAAPQPQVREAAPPSSSIGPPELPVRTSPKAPAAAPVIKKASVETRQAPVPLQVKARPPVMQPAPDSKATEAKASEPASQQEAAANGDSFNEKAVKAAIEADGYKGVTVLRKGVNGVWHASALRGKTTVMLTVDASGSVAAE
jgi:hypothetical protein